MGCKSEYQRSTHIKKRLVIGKEDVDKEKLKEKGRIHYFYHSPSSTLPIRDVRNEQCQGHKTEPHIEIGAENYVGPCRPTNIVAHLKHDDEKYLFLVTTCRNRNMKECGKPYVIGYIEKSEKLIINSKRQAVKGRIVIFPFEESVPYYDIFSHFTPVRLVDERKTREILAKFPALNEQRRNALLQACIKEIKKLDKDNKKSKKTCLVLRGCTCEYQKKCLRWNL